MLLVSGTDKSTITRAMACTFALFRYVEHRIKAFAVTKWDE
jgi:hypothetical protein